MSFNSMLLVGKKPACTVIVFAVYKNLQTS